jgi:hypothetical protein
MINERFYARAAQPALTSANGKFIIRYFNQNTLIKH